MTATGTYRKSLMELMSALGREISMSEENQVLIAMTLANSEEKIKTFFAWLRGKLSNNKVTVNQEQIMHAVMQIARGEKPE